MVIAPPLQFRTAQQAGFVEDTPDMLEQAGLRVGPLRGRPLEAKEGTGERSQEGEAKNKLWQPNSTRTQGQAGKEKKKEKAGKQPDLGRPEFVVGSKGRKENEKERRHKVAKLARAQKATVQPLL